MPQIENSEGISPVHREAFNDTQKANESGTPQERLVSLNELNRHRVQPTNETLADKLIQFVQNFYD